MRLLRWWNKQADKKLDTWQVVSFPKDDGYRYPPPSFYEVQQMTEEYAPKSHDQRPQARHK